MKLNPEHSTMFNSQKINSGIRYETAYDAAASQKFMREVIYDPRPEFDNNPNPILVAFRDSWAEDISLAADRFVDSLCDEPTARNYYTPEHQSHARKVLERLAEMEKLQ